MKKNLGLMACLLGVTACNEIPPGAYYNRGDPENLLDASSETVTLSLTSPDAIADLSSMISQDPPIRAELGCNHSDAVCQQAKAVLDRRKIAVQWAGSSNGVTLIYERIVARDCENRYIDNSINPYNLEPPTFGCSMMANTVQMVSDRHQFVSPNLLDFQDGEKAVQTYDTYLTPTPPSNQPQQDTSAPITAKQNTGRD